jgi:TPR repeat protein
LDFHNDAAPRRARAVLPAMLFAGTLALATPSLAQSPNAPFPGDPIDAALNRGDFATVMKLVQPMADQGDPKGENVVGLLYYRGWGVRQDSAKAAFWYEKAAEQGVVAAENNLGTLYKDGRGVPQDFEKAAYWFRKAADQGATQAFFNLGTLYEAGLGVPQDYKEAAAWYRKAATAGLEDWNRQNTPPH